MTTPMFEITSSLSLNTIETLIATKEKIKLSASLVQKNNACREYLNQKTKNSKKSYYGINTGFGFLQNVSIDDHQTAELQLNLIQSHACGVGEEVPAEIVRLMLLLKIQSLSYGHSGVQVELIHRLIDFYNNDILPVVYTQGSLGASGDLAPLSHLALPLIGLGEVVVEGNKISSSEMLARKGWKSLSLQSKEGLALINGTQFMSAYGVYCLLQCKKLLATADMISAISLDAFDGSIEPFHEKIHLVRNHPGQTETAKTLRLLLEGSHLIFKEKNNVQDPYSFRCIPQVHGASKDTYGFVRDVFSREINSVTDNPNIFPADDLILSGGNFHGQILSFGLDFLSIALAEIGNISERRTFQLLSGNRNLPLFLVSNPGLNSGLMILQYTAASIVSENKQFCTPASVDSIVSSNGQEDHVSMGANAATKCLRVLHNVEKILAVELITATQAMEFRKPMKTSPVLENIILEFRKKVSFNTKDRILSKDIAEAMMFIKDLMNIPK